MAELTTDERRMKMAMGVLEAADARGFARAINVFTASPIAGDYHLFAARALPQVLNAKKLNIHLGDGESVGYVILREPVSCNWMAVPQDSISAEGWSFDVFDLMWRSAPLSVFEKQDDAVEAALLSSGFLAPWISTRMAAYKALRRVRDSWEKWNSAFLDSDDFGSIRCEGCDLCDGGIESVHRLPRDEQEWL